MFINSFSFSFIICSTFLLYSFTTSWIFSSIFLETSSLKPSFLSSSKISLLIFLIAILPSSAYSFVCLTSSLLLSSVKGGIVINTLSPLLLGVTPRLASNMAFSIAPRILLSNGLIFICLASGTDIVASCLTWVGVP